MPPKCVNAIILLTAATQILSWQLPLLPAGKRTQYYLLNEDGGYKYGYDTGSGYFAKQSGDSANQVEGHYNYQDSNGKNVDLKYTAGVQGFVPEGLDHLKSDVNEEVGHPDGSYSFSYSTDDHGRQESGDASGNVKGSYSYSNKAGTHDLSYIAGAETGFQLTGGSLAAPGGPQTNLAQDVPTSYTYQAQSDEKDSTGDASYSFAIDTDEYKRQESSDAQGNIQGRYSYQNKDGTHDLSYIAGSQTGFVATGGSLATPSGVPDSNIHIPNLPLHSHTQTSHSEPGASDGSYSFSIDTDEYQRKESADSSGNVQGRYSYKNKDGSHDLSYIAGSQTGFVATGGSLATPNGVPDSNIHIATVPSHSHTQTSHSEPGASDGSYSFSIDTDEYQRKESADSSGNVQGRFSYQNKDGTHDLSYIAGSQTGFVATGGSLATPNGVPDSDIQIPSLPLHSHTFTTHSEPSTSDGSYSFSIDTDEYQRKESADSSGNVHGRYSYQNKDGTHDLSYIAGSQTGFVATDGSLSQPNGLLPQSNYASPYSYHIPPSSGDGTYSFVIDTNDYQRQESADASGTVKGRYSYKNAAGSHDLSFVAGSATGFLPIGGSLKDPPGLEHAPSVINSKTQFPAHGYLQTNNDNYSIKTYLPLSADKKKYGYIFESNY